MDHVTVKSDILPHMMFYRKKKCPGACRLSAHVLTFSLHGDTKENLVQPTTPSSTFHLAEKKRSRFPELEIRGKMGHEGRRNLSQAINF